MPRYEHIITRASCPHLPEVSAVVRPSDIKSLKICADRESYYLSTLRCAQSLWKCGLPAQALLQLNMALGEKLPSQSPTLQGFPLPYQAKVWIMQRWESGEFIGNPVRHYQHLATRMNGKNKNLRVARAWVCFHLAKLILPEEHFPEDADQILMEKLTIPSLQNTLNTIPDLSERNLIQSLIPFD